MLKKWDRCSEIKTKNAKKMLHSRRKQIKTQGIIGQSCKRWETGSETAMPGDCKEGINISFMF